MSISLFHEQYIRNNVRIKLQTLLSPNILHMWAFISFTKTKGPIVKPHYTNTHIPPDYVSCLNQHRIKGRKHTNLSSLQTHYYWTLMLLSDAPSGKTNFYAGSKWSVIKTWQTKERKYWANVCKANHTEWDTMSVLRCHYTNTATVLEHLSYSEFQTSFVFQPLMTFKLTRPKLFK